jgi:hypothetical protein
LAQLNSAPDIEGGFAMSSQNAFPKPNGARAAAPSPNQEPSRQPSWVNPQAQPGYAQQGANSWPPQDNAGYQGGYPSQQGYGEPPSQNPEYGHWSELQAGHHNEPAQAPIDPYAPQFEPYVPPSRGAGRQPAPGINQQPASQWPGRGGIDPHAFGAGNYGAAPGYAPQPGQGGPAFGGDQPYREPELSASDWAGQPGEFGSDPYHGHGDDLGFAQAEGGELDAYGEDDGDYEDDEAPRSRRPLMIVAALVGAVLLGGTMAYGYKKLGLNAAHGDPPTIKSAEFPAKTKPADAGGKVFPYTDTKIMGRLGDGTPSSLPPAAPDTTQSASAASPADDDGGPRKVSTLVVGRDGSIQQPPDSPAPAPPSAQVAVPGTSLVDVFGQQNSGGPSHSAASSGRDEPLPQPKQSKSVSGYDTPAPVKNAAPVKITKLNSVSKDSTASSIDDAAGSRAHSKKHLKKVARAETPTTSDAYDPSAPVTSSGAGSGYVAVLASIPHSSSSRMDALKRYADMQQKYSTVLSGKTPDVAAANLGTKGRYDRLIVGPPGSRQEASNVCTQLKAVGYTTCWVTSY